MTLRKMIRYWRKAFETWGMVADQFGWRRSHILGRPVDASGEAIPWYTYSAIEFIRTLDLAEARVFEYGCGNSSIFWAARTREVFAVEGNAEWAKIVRGLGVPHLTVMEEAEMDHYASAPLTAGGAFDIVVIDGRHRRTCASIANRVVSENGIIIFDNADWYPDACADLREQGWFQIDFSGLGPINSYAWTTAVFLKTTLAFGRTPNVQPIGGNPSGAV